MLVVSQKLTSAPDASAHMTLLHFSNLPFVQVCITLITIINCHTTLNMIGSDVLSYNTGICISVRTNAL